MSPAPRPCLTGEAGELADYAAGRLRSAQSAAWQAHLACCARCRFTLAEEERVRTLLAVGPPPMPGGLQATLLALADSVGSVRIPLTAPVSQSGSWTPLPVALPGAPPAHRSAVRSALMATAVAVAGLAAVWGGAALTVADGAAVPMSADGSAGSSQRPLVRPVGVTDEPVDRTPGEANTERGTACGLRSLLGPAWMCLRNGAESTP